MPNPLTPSAPTRIFVVPGRGRKTPLPIPGYDNAVPAEGRLVVNSLAVLRLLRCGDLIEAPSPEGAKATPSAAAKAVAAVGAAAPTDTKEG